MPSRKSVALSRISASAGWLRRHKDQITSHADGSSTTPKVRLGVCAMDKKAQSKPMLAILKRMNTAHEFELVFFGDDVRFKLFVRSSRPFDPAGLQSSKCHPHCEHFKYCRTGVSCWHSQKT
jgi:Diphosphoinositol pentakisphosphate kinase 2 N-terminal domain